MKVLSALVLSLLALSLSAQSVAPDFTCVEGEIVGSQSINTVRWQNVAESCGPFVATEIYRSSLDLGTGNLRPFSLVGTVTDPAATSFEDPTDGATYFYFLRYDYDCGTAVGPNSDTLRSGPLQSLDIRYFSWEDNGLRIAYTASSPQTTNYVISVAEGVNVVLDTVGNQLAYTIPYAQLSANPNEIATTRFIVEAFDAVCGNTSPQSQPLSPTSVAFTGGEGCTSALTFLPDLTTLNTFEAITVSGLELFISVNGGPFAGQGVVPANSSEILYADANDGEEICFYIEAIVAGTEERFRTFRPECVTIMINQPVRDFDLFGVEEVSGGGYRFQFDDGLMQGTVLVAELQVLRGGGEIGVLPLTPPIFGQNGELAVGPFEPIPTPGEPLRLEVTDDCDRTARTNAVEPIRLTARTAGPGGNLLEWSPLINDLEGTITYSVFRVDTMGGGAPALLASGLTELEFSDETVTSGGETCYFVVARFTPTLGDGTPGSQSYDFRSLPRCVVPRPVVYLPNAFNPESVTEANATFRPFFATPPVLSRYELTIFDRWGAVAFQTTDPGEGWDGRIAGERAASGVYIYVLEYATSQTSEARSGTVNLLR